MALDVGKRRIGIAVSDPLGVIASPHSTMERNRETTGKIATLIRDLDVQLLVVGLPLYLSGEESEQAKDVRTFVEHITSSISIPVEYRDERLTSIEAEQRLANRSPDWRERKKKIDAVAAALILEDFLKGR